MPKQKLHGSRAVRVKRHWMKDPFLILPIYLQIDPTEILLAVHIDKPILALRSICDHKLVVIRSGQSDLEVRQHIRYVRQAVSGRGYIGATDDLWG